MAPISEAKMLVLSFVLAGRIALPVVLADLTSSALFVVGAACLLMLEHEY